MFWQSQNKLLKVIFLEQKKSVTYKVFASDRKGRNFSSLASTSDEKIRIFWAEWRHEYMLA